MLGMDECVPMSEPYMRILRNLLRVPRAVGYWLGVGQTRALEKGEDLKDRVAWKMSTIAKELRAYEDELGNGTANLENAARKTGQLAQPLKSNPLVAGALKKATGMVKEMNKSLDKPIADVKKNEEALFKRVPR